MKRGLTTTNWDAVIASTPMNRDAAIVASGKGGAFVPRKAGIVQPWDAHSDAPLPIAPVTEKMRRLPKFVDLSGTEIGKLTVVGISSTKDRNRSGHAWVVRCRCGKYEHRRTKSLRNMMSIAGIEPIKRAECKECDYTREMLAGRTGVAFPKQTLGAKK